MRLNIIDNVNSVYESSGYFWENYIDTNGKGQKNHPFTGWTALYVLILNEDYWWLFDYHKVNLNVHNLYSNINLHISNKCFKNIIFNNFKIIFQVFKVLVKNEITNFYITYLKMSGLSFPIYSIPDYKMESKTINMKQLR